jgi:protein-disulfide isomerase
MASAEVRDRVLTDIAMSNRLGLPGTPSFFVNDVQIALPSSLAEFERIIFDAIQNQ